MSTNMTKPFQIDEGVIYITNVCNLTCDICMTYNNRRFTGHYEWINHLAELTEWSSKVDINAITILGGEPFSHLDLLGWVNTIRNLWNTCESINVCTNGTYFKTHKELAIKILKKNVWFDVCIHDPASKEEIKNNLEDILSSIGNFEIEKSITNDIGHHPVNEEIYYINGIMVARICDQWDMSSMSTAKIVGSTTYMHNSDPEIAHSNCSANKCHYFVNGKLYKCFLTAIGQEFTTQFDVEPRAKDLLTNYTACSPWDSEADITKFFEVLDKPIPQCTLCPEKRISVPIWPLEKLKKKI